MSQFVSGYFPSRDGTRLHGVWTAPRSAPRGSALVLHGYGDHGGRYVEVADKLADLGLAAFTIDYRGHGKAEGARGHCELFDDYLDDLDVALERVAAAGVPGPRLIVAHSHGSLISLRALADPTRTLGVDGAVLSSPYLSLALPVSPLKTGAGRIASRFAPRFAQPSGIAVSDLTHDQQKRAEAERDALRHPVATARWYTESTQAQAYVREWAHRIEVPTLWLIAGDDRLVSARTSRDVFGKAGGDKELRLYEGFYHEVFNEIDRARVFDDLRGWILRHFPALARAA